MNKKLVAMGLFSAATLVVAGCGTANSNSSNGNSSGNSQANLTSTSGTAGSASGASAPVKIQLWESHSSGPVANAEQQLVNQFNASHSNVKVSLNITHASKKALAAVTAGQPPVLAEISHYIGKYVGANALLDMHALSSNNPQTFWPGVSKNTTWGGKLYRYPADVKVEEFYYNKALFKKAGIASVPTTWTQLASDLQKLKSLGVIPMGFKDSSAHILSAFISNGGQLFSNTARTKVQFNNAAGQATFTYFRNLFQQKDMVFGHGNTMRADFGAQKMAIVDGTSAGYQKILAATGGKFQMGAFAFPAGISGHSGAIVQGLGFVLFNGVSPADQKAAWTFVHWFNEPKQQAYWSMHSGFAPTTSAGAKAIPSSWLAANQAEAVSVQILKSQNTVARPNTDAYSEVQSALDAAFFNAVTGKQTISTALTNLDTQANQYLSGKSAL
ncbi:extracellular solute-binding protein [Alicyclobacillus mengziensis]|uniref:Extracellular solute-binding protein n=1 Tax=Alicyclobacillus mengziensis TaxID=2931921 RepID=A0A9X7VYF8_9BACL|nr:extracellular solute-binding protein [Alicyclobacillus mengziensis]QSO46043.1 extracellular solute-binding protein [Alicyclobacillus mengziensis]